MAFSPTDEQTAALDKFRTGSSLKINAFAGTGKTTTLTLLAESNTQQGLYLAFNKSIADDAKTKFPRNVDCRTTHSLAFRSIQSAYRFSKRKMTDRLPPQQLAEIQNLQDKQYSRSFALTGRQRAFLRLEAIKKFCQSADARLKEKHFPSYGRLRGIAPEVRNAVAWDTLISSFYLWEEMKNPRSEFPLGHDGYLKLWALSNPRLPVSYILLDEAQDTNEVVLGVLRAQDAQLVYVGDRHQQIYEWRGAINAMDFMPSDHEAYLTQSFRFGEAIASAATKLLKRLGEANSLSGNPAVTSNIGTMRGKGAVLSRTNSAVIQETLNAIDSGSKPYVTGGTKEQKRLVGDVYNLKQGKPAYSHEFFGFNTWNQVVEFSESDEGEDIRSFVQLVQQYGEAALWRALSNAHGDEPTADIVLSTAHKAKGREWDKVRITSDFLSSKFDASTPLPKEEIRLFYVAITRAKQLLDVDPSLLKTYS